MPNPYGSGLRNATPVGTTAPQRLTRGRNFRGGGFLIGGAGASNTIVRESATPVAPKPDPLKDLVINPVYEKEKHTPKIIELP